MASLPPRLLPVDAAAERELSQRTLTNLYNRRPSWLAQRHASLDAAVWASYGWDGGVGGGGVGASAGAERRSGRGRGVGAGRNAPPTCSCRNVGGVGGNSLSGSFSGFPLPRRPPGGSAPGSASTV